MAIKFITQLKPPRANGHKIHYIIKPPRANGHKIHYVIKPPRAKGHKIHHIIKPPRANGHKIHYIIKPPRAIGHKIHYVIKPQSVICFKYILIMEAYCTTKPWNNGKHRQHYRKGNCFTIPTRPNTCNSFYKLSRKIVKIDHGPIPFPSTEKYINWHS